MTRPLQDSLLGKIRISESGCWLWQGDLAPNQYGLISRQRNGLRRRLLAHRVVYELFRGPIPAGLQIDHLCRVKPCVNPTHLEAVTQQENLLRGDTIVASNAAKTHCPQGHAYTTQNTYSFRGSRHCRTCRVTYRQRRKQRLEGADNHA